VPSRRKTYKAATAIASKTTLVAPIRLARPRLGAAGAGGGGARGASGRFDALEDFFLRLT
jgi:hypothetical protein